MRLPQSAALLPIASLFIAGVALADVRQIIVRSDKGAAETEVFFLNEGKDAAAHTPPESIIVDGQALHIVGEGTPQTIAPGGFVRQLYGGADSVKAAPTRTESAGTEGGQTGLKKFETYQPIYALIGASPLDAKLQLSFKYLLLGDRPQWPSQDARWGVYFGYTQRLFWDLEQDSIPIRDFTFSPELFFYMTSAEAPEPGRPQFAVQAGMQHESNGKGDAQSRSLNTLYIEPSITAALDDGWQLKVAPRAWAYFGSQKNNEQIERFRGYTGLTLGLVKPQSYGGRSYFRLNPVRGKGSAEIDVFYSLAQKSPIDVALHVQLFTGHGETLLDYDRRSTRLRFGLSIVQ